MTSQHESVQQRCAIAERIFAALCAQYPDKYIALIQPRDIANDACRWQLPVRLKVSPAKTS
jgi:hypothetical protein